MHARRRESRIQKFIFSLYSGDLWASGWKTLKKVRTKQFFYKNIVRWQEARKGLLSSAGKPAMEVATPPEFKGHAGIWTPEDLFVASVNICIMTTFLFYAEKKNLEFLKYESEAEGILERVGNNFMFSTVNIRPKILVRNEDGRFKAQELIKLSEEGCLISNSIKSSIKIFPEITVAPE